MRKKQLMVLAAVCLVFISVGYANAASQRSVRQTRWQSFLQQRNERRESIKQRFVNASRPTVVKPVATNMFPKPSAIIPATSQSSYSMEKIANLINAERQKNGLGQVRLNSALGSAAAAKSKHMTDHNYFAHTAPDGTTDWSFIDKSGYNYSKAGANLAKGDFGSEAGLVDAWMESPGHKANILANFGQDLGIGVSGNYFTMFIARPM
ncbi:MAG TPA: CAP domain-containing protein [bacterium]|nr:CAP domain-containing protein [bacterium]